MSARTSLTKIKLASRLWETFPLRLKDAEEVVDLFFNVIKKSLIDGEVIHLRPFGTLVLHYKPARLASSCGLSRTLSSAHGLPSRKTVP